jgi:hypothetical protein
MSRLYFCFGKLYLLVENFFLKNACVIHKYVVPLQQISLEMKSASC